MIPHSRQDGNTRTVNVREVMNGLMYSLRTGCQRRTIPKDLPPRSTVNYYFCRWQYEGTLERLHHALYVLCREQVHRDASPTVSAGLWNAPSAVGLLPTPEQGLGEPQSECTRFPRHQSG